MSTRDSSIAEVEREITGTSRRKRTMAGPSDYEDDDAFFNEIDKTLLKGRGSDTLASDLSSDDVLVARKISKDRVRYYTREEFYKKYGDTKKLRDQILLIKGKDGVRRTLPQVYYSAEIPKGTPPREAHSIRKEHFVSEMARLDVGYIPIKFERERVKRDDGNAHYDTPGGKRTRKYNYTNKVLAGETLPDVMYRRQDGKLVGGYVALDENLKGKSFQDIRKLSGFEMKSMHHSFSTPETLDTAFGNGVAENRHNGYLGKSARPDAGLPDVIVRVGNKYLSADLILQKAADSEAAQALKGNEKYLKRLKALMLNKSGTSYMPPELVKKFDSDYFESLSKKRGLPSGFEKINRDYRLGRIMVQASKTGFRFGDDAEINQFRGKFKEMYGDTRVFIQGDNSYGKKTGIMGMLRTYERGDKSIPKEVAKDIGINDKAGPRDKRRDDLLKRYEQETEKSVSTGHSAESRRRGGRAAHAMDYD